MLRVIMIVELLALLVALGVIGHRLTATEPGPPAAVDRTAPARLKPSPADEPRPVFGQAPSPLPASDRHPLPPLDDPRVVVETSRLCMTVFDGDRPVKRYRVAVGARPGPKRSEGDLRTPQGEFYICIKKGAGQTPYHRSMGLSYPTPGDARRALEAGRITRDQHDRIVYAHRRRTRPPWNTPLGGAIMIHGCRNGRDETQGCVAVDNDEAEELFQRLPMGTVVIIRP